jgi:hypothetical protein
MESLNNRGWTLAGLVIARLTGLYAGDRLF